jgi:hypothetical protein
MAVRRLENAAGKFNPGDLGKYPAKISGMQFRCGPTYARAKRLEKWEDAQNHCPLLQEYASLTGVQDE